MDDYQVHTLDSAPEQSHAVLEQANKAYGMIPNLMAVMAESRLNPFTKVPVPIRVSPTRR